MRSFKKTATIIGLGLLVSKLVVAATASPLNNSWSGPLLESADRFTGTGITLNLRVIDRHVKNSYQDALSLRFTGPESVMQAYGLTSREIICSISEIGTSSNPTYNKYIKLSKGYGSWDADYDNPLCSFIAIKAEPGWTDIDVGFKSKAMIARLKMDNDRGLVVGHAQKMHFNEWARRK
ncbi:hypothetical protein KIH32_01210 [Pseudomonas fluorescens]|uniref:hypothetical protein n=1 Tax=Pseudomonas fluorescens TaxID=294 RepID=UPI001BD9F342|nr:hypothetical protein [Pseudomonas fluorescens]MBT0622508.1 hypothetical protein [Pseudomonas fluorescens]